MQHQRPAGRVLDAEDLHLAQTDDHSQIRVGFSSAGGLLRIGLRQTRFWRPHPRHRGPSARSNPKSLVSALDAAVAGPSGGVSGKDAGHGGEQRVDDLAELAQVAGLVEIAEPVQGGHGARLVVFRVTRKRLRTLLTWPAKAITPRRRQRPARLTRLRLLSCEDYPQYHPRRPRRMCSLRRTITSIGFCERPATSVPKILTALPHPQSPLR